MKTAIMLKGSTLGHLTQWGACPEPKRFFRWRDSIEKIRAYNPDVVFINKGREGFKDNLIQIANEFKSIYFYGDYRNPLDAWVANIGSNCNLVMVMFKQSDLWQQFKPAKVVLVHQGAGPSFTQLLTNEIIYDIAFAGHNYGRKFLDCGTRIDVMDRLFKDGFKVALMGEGWPARFESGLLGKKMPKTVTKVYSRSHCILSLSNVNNVPYCTSNRLFNAMASSRPCIAWHAPKVSTIFDDSYVEVKNYNELKQKILEFKNDPKTASNLGNAQRQYTLANHTIKHAWDRIECIIKKELF
jgi:hypothetical protein